MKIIIEISDDELYEFQDQIAEWLVRIENAIEKIEAQAEDDSKNHWWLRGSNAEACTAKSGWQ